MTATAPRPEADTYVGDEMTLVEHLVELRTRLFKCAVALVLGFAIGFVFREQVLDVVIQPYCDLNPRLRAASTAFDPDGCQLIFTDVLGAFFLSIKASAIIATLIAAPVVCYQVWRFVTPGLRPVEKRYAIPFVLLSQLLFAGGAVFAYTLLPRALNVLLSFAGDNVASLMDAGRYLNFVLQTMIGFGIAFEFPLILAILSLMGVVTSAGLRRNRRYALLGTFVAAAFITPTTDPFTMTAMAGPLVLFYEFAILFARFIERRRAKQAAAAA